MSGSERDPTWHEQQVLYTLKRIALALEVQNKRSDPDPVFTWTCESCDCTTNEYARYPGDTGLCRVCGRSNT